MESGSMLVETFIRGTGQPIKNKGKDIFIFPKMKLHMMDNGSKISWKDMEFKRKEMAIFTKDNSKKD